MKWGRKVLIVSIIGAAGLTSGCADTTVTRTYMQDNVVSSLIQPPERQITEDNSGYAHPEEKDSLPVITRKTDKTAQHNSDNCSLGDRFDDDGALAYNFADNQARLALHLSIDGPKLSDPARLEVEEAMLRFTYKFREGRAKAKPREKAFCLYSSRYQGLLGSVYHELYHREGKNAFDEAIDKLEERELDFWR